MKFHHMRIGSVNVAPPSSITRAGARGRATSLGQSLPGGR